MKVHSTSTTLPSLLSLDFTDLKINQIAKSVEEKQPITRDEIQVIHSAIKKSNNPDVKRDLYSILLKVFNSSYPKGNAERGIDDEIIWSLENKELIKDVNFSDDQLYSLADKLAPFKVGTINRNNNIIKIFNLLKDVQEIPKPIKYKLLEFKQFSINLQNRVPIIELFEDKESSPKLLSPKTAGLLNAQLATEEKNEATVPDGKLKNIDLLLQSGKLDLTAFECTEKPLKKTYQRLNGTERLRGYDAKLTEFRQEYDGVTPDPNNYEKNVTYYTKELLEKFVVAKDADKQAIFDRTARLLWVYTELNDNKGQYNFVNQLRIDFLNKIARSPVIDLKKSDRADKYLSKAVALEQDKDLLLGKIDLCINSSKTDIPPILASSILQKLPIDGDIQDQEIITNIAKKLKNVGSVPETLVNSIINIIQDKANGEKTRELAQSILEKMDITDPVQTKNIQLIDKSISDSRDKKLPELLEAIEKSTGTDDSIKKLITSDLIKNILSDVDKISNTFGSFNKVGSVLKKNIKALEPEDIAIWAKNVKADQSQGKLDRYNPKIVAEALAVVSRAMYLTKGYMPRDTQKIAVTIMLYASEQEKGRLLQINTGEGKSNIIAMLATMEHLFSGRSIDVITSSAVLAKRDADEQEHFYSLFNISCSHNIHTVYSGLKPCYKHDIVYGDAANFQSDILRSEFSLKGTRGARETQFAIVDEVDAMLIDEGSKIVKLSAPICGMENLQLMFLYISRSLEKYQSEPELLNNKEVRTKVREGIIETIDSLITGLKFPEHLVEFVESSKTHWANSAINSILFQENKDYIITKDDTGNDIVAPVDYQSTGVVQNTTRWANGLHQFLQIKHKLHFTGENLTTSFISNLSFFKRYGANICGMTGTLGSEPSLKLLKEIYNVDTGIIPPFRGQNIKGYEGIISPSHEEHHVQIVSRAMDEATKGRSVLVIMQTIADGHQIIAGLKHNNHPSSSIKSYLRDDVVMRHHAFTGRSESGDIIVATNLAGRGTDILTTDKIEENGGLHVILGFLPNNLRVEKQAIGRTARQGNNGSSEIIINGKETARMFGIEYQQETSLAEYKGIRDIFEQKNLDDVKLKRLARIEFQDKLFQRFNKEVYQFLREKDPDKNKLLQLEDHWGFWLSKVTRTHDINNGGDRIKIDNEFYKFQKTMIEKYGAVGNHQIFNNPSYFCQYIMDKQGLEFNYRQCFDLYEEAVKLDSNFSYPLHYYHAYCALQENSKNDKEQGYEQIAIEQLHFAIQQIENSVIPQTQGAKVLLGIENDNTPMGRQLSSKLTLLEATSNNIKRNIQYIQEQKSNKSIIRINNHNLQTFDKIFGDSVPSSEIVEFARNGMLYVFEALAQAKTKDHLTGALVAVVGVAQVVVGTLIAVGSAGFAANFGIGLAVGGISDVITGIEHACKGQGIDLSQWALQKSIELSVNLVISGIAGGSSGKEALKQGGKEIVANNAMKKTISTMTLREFGAQLGIQLIKTGLQKAAANQLEQISARPIKKAIKDAEERVRAALNDYYIKAQVEDILTVDDFYNSRQYGSQLDNLNNRLLNKRSSEFSSIAQKLLTATMQANSSSTVLTTVIGVGSTAVNVSNTLNEIDELQDFYIDGMRGEIISINDSLPSLEQILTKKLPIMSQNDIKEVVEHFKNTGAIGDKRQVNVDKLGFVLGIDLLSKEQDKKEVVNSNPQSTNIESILLEPSTVNNQLILEDFSKKTEDLSEDIITIESNPQNKVTYTNSNQNAASRIFYQLYQKQSIDRTQAFENFRDNSAKALGHRMQGMIYSGIISPVSGELVKHTVNFVTEQIKLHQHNIEKQFLLENYRKAGLILPEISGVSGISAGDEEEIDSEKEHKLTRNKNSKSLFATKNNTAIDRVIEKTFSIFADKYDQSLEESQKHENISSVNLFAERNREINANVSAIRRGSGHAVFKNASEFNETMGGTIRYMFDQASHISHVVSPEITGLFNASTGTMGHGVTELYQLTMPDNAKRFLAQSYNHMMGQFPTENQRFLVQTTMGTLAGQMTAKGINLAVINKANNPTATSALSTSNAALETERKLAIVITHNAQNVNSLINLNKKMSALQKAQTKSIKTLDLGNGRVRYYEKEIPSKKLGLTRGASYVTEHNQITGQVRSWHECYDHSGKINRVHPKMIDGQDIKGQHYPPTKEEISIFLKQNKY
jgi:hypothetical protein